MEPTETRIACVDLPALPLQILLQDRPAWRTHPCAVVADDRPQGEISWVDERARRAGVRPGMRFAAARSLVTGLRAAVVPSDRIEHAVGSLFTTLCSLSPRVEPAPGEPGVFWLDPGGLLPLHGSLEQWARAIHERLSGAGWRSAVVVGFHRFRTRAIARTHVGSWVIHDAAREARVAASVALEHLGLSPRLRDELALLGIRTLGDFSALPRSELRLRFGEEAEHLHDAASDAHWHPLRARPLVDPIDTVVQLEPPETDTTRLLFVVKTPLGNLLDRLAARGQALSALELELRLDHAGVHRERVEPAGPTLDLLQLLDLIRLRLDGLRLPAGIEELHARAEGIRAAVAQLTLFRAARRRDLETAERALARLRALFGPSSVTRAEIHAAHLPEARFGWRPIRQLEIPSPSSPMAELPLVRRVLSRPMLLPDRPLVAESWPNVDPRQGPVVALHGPFRLSGGWWVRTVERDYYYAEMRRGDVLWIYWDRPRRKWFLHGTVD
jgi:protein ImuB